MIKKCHVCGEEKAHKHSKQTTCDECLNKGFKWCKGCNTTHSLSNFGMCGKSKNSLCRSCSVNRVTKYNETYEYKNKKNEKRRMLYNTDEEFRNAEIVRCHNRRCKVQQAGTFTILDWNKTLNIFSNKCAYCGSPVGLTQDHIIPISKEGSNTIDNIIPACGHCNSSKCANDMEEWFRKQSFFDEEKLRNIKLYVAMFQEER